MQSELEFPRHLDFLIFTPARYKVLWGGRGAGKTENIARALIILASQKRLRIVCFRELQNSIGESVHETIKQWIFTIFGDEADKEFDIGEKTIVSKRTGSEFIFSGLRYNIDRIKSMARIDIAWIEEARNVSKNSWDKLAPTIRGRHESDPNGMGGPFGLGPEIWVSFNPELDDDETYKRFVLNPPREFNDDGTRYAIVKKVNWSDNKWFPPDQMKEMMDLKAKDPNAWLEVWEGNTKQVLEGAIFAEEIRKAVLENRITKVKYDPNRPVNTFWDLGHSDQTAIWFVQTVGVEFNVIDYYENSLKKFPYYIKVLQEKGYNYGTHNLPHDGDAETVSNITPRKQLADIGYRVRIIDRPTRKYIGINAVRTVFDLCNFDEQNTADGITRLRRYCYKVNEETGHFSKEPLHDENSNGSDAFQTFALSMKSETASTKKKYTPKVVPFVSPQGWMN